MGSVIAILVLVAFVALAVWGGVAPLLPRRFSRQESARGAAGRERSAGERHASGPAAEDRQ